MAPPSDPLAKKADTLAMQNYWHDKVALVTGGSAGLGFAIAAALSQAGAKLAICGRNEATLAAAAQKLQAAAPGRDVLTVTADMTRDEDVERLVADTVARFGRLDLLVNNVGR